MYSYKSVPAIWSASYSEYRPVSLSRYASCMMRNSAQIDVELSGLHAQRRARACYTRLGIQPESGSRALFWIPTRNFTPAGASDSGSRGSGSRLGLDPHSGIRNQFYKKSASAGSSRQPDKVRSPQRPTSSQQGDALS